MGPRRYFPMRVSIITALSSFVFCACAAAPFANPETDSGSPVPVEEGGAPPPPPGCHIEKLPSDDPCVLDESAGVFVSTSLGSAAGDGTRTHPFASIQTGIDHAKATKRRVYVCAEAYAESIAIADG